jgi:hypothetical protein
MNILDLNQSELIHRISVLERTLSTLTDVQNRIVDAQTEEASKAERQYIHQNLIRNGDLNFTRNTYLYTTDYTGPEAANVSEEAAFIYGLPRDDSRESYGSINSGNTTLTINNALFTPSDVGKNIIIEGAGTGGSVHFTNIFSYISATQCVIGSSAATTVTNARVRWGFPSYIEDTTDDNPDSNLATNTALKTPSHTRYSTTVNDPDFDKTNGWIRYNKAENVIGFPLKYNNIFPSRNYIVSFHYKLAQPVNGSTEADPKFYAGIWNSKPEVSNWLEASDKPNLSATYTGTPGSTSREYLVLLFLASGETIATKKVTVNNTAATLNSNNYVTLSWEQERHVIKSEIWSFVGGVYRRIAFPYPSNTYYDMGNVINTGAGYPSATWERYKALVSTDENSFPIASSKGWKRGQMNIIVPSKWDSSQAGKLWLIIGIKNTLVGTGSDHCILIDLVSMDDKSGVFSMCPLDFQAKRNTTTTTNQGDQGPLEIPPIPPGGGNCPVLTDLITTNAGDIEAWKLVDNEDKYLIKLQSGNYSKYTATIKREKEIITIITDKGKELTGSSRHKIITSDYDITGKHLKNLSKNDIIVTIDGEEKIISIIKKPPQHVVKISLKSEEKIYIHNGIFVHNRKEEPNF